MWNPRPKVEDLTDARTPTCSVEMRDRDSGLGVGERDGGGEVREGVGGQNNGLRPVWEWTPARVGAEERHRGTRVQARRIHGKSKNGGCLALNKVNVATCECNVATFQRRKQPTSRLSHPDSQPDKIGGSEPSSGCENIY